MPASLLPLLEVLAALALGWAQGIAGAASLVGLVEMEVVGGSVSEAAVLFAAMVLEAALLGYPWFAN